jgi:signal transduction histidine kinase
MSYAGHIHRSGEHLLNIVNDILDMAKIESGVQPLQREAVDVSAVVTAAVSFVEGLAAQRGLRVRAEPINAIPPVLADERYTRQVLINLLSNAIKFSPPGFEIQVAARYTGTQAVEIAVADRGPGIDSTLMRRLGEPFLQGNPAVSRGGQGTGLGLSICKHYMDLLGGELLIQSAVGLGTVATIRFPPALVVAPGKT